MTMVERKSNIRLTKDTPLLSLTGELRSVFCDDFEENWLGYNGIALHYDRTCCLIFSSHLILAGVL